MPELYEKHRERLERAVEACATRGHWTPFIESPSRRLHPEGALEKGRAAFEARLGKRFDLGINGTVGWIGAERSPYTQEPLAIEYPKVDVDVVAKCALAAMPAWRDAGPTTRVGVCMEMLDRFAAASFENAFATMHTAGQSFMMAFAGSGANSLDRGLEGIAYAHQAMSAIPTEAVFERAFGKGANLRIEKRYRLMPRGLAVVISCGSYPAWNAYPAIFANLATGNPVVVKTHPGAILPMAIMVEIGREVLREAGFSADLLTLAADTWEQPNTKILLDHPATAIVDFTGGQTFGNWIETNCADKLVYTETAGCNAVVLESVDTLEPVARAIATGIAIFSSQMCTAPQNIFIPGEGVRTAEGLVSVDEFSQALVDAIDAIAADPAVAAGLCGAVQAARTFDDIARLTAVSDGGGRRILRPSQPYQHPEFPNARTATPLVVATEADDELYRSEHFGPVAFVITTDDREHALQRATEDARTHGAIASYAYTTDSEFLANVHDRFAEAGASVGCNLIRQHPINYTAAYSDFHVTGLNPAGNACLTDLAFVTQRFRIVQSKTELP